MSVDNFISAVKAKRDEHLEAVAERITDENGHYDAGDRIEDTDRIIGAVLDLVEEHIGDFTTACNDDGVEVEVTCASDLATLYFEEVNS